MNNKVANIELKHQHRYAYWALMLFKVVAQTQGNTAAGGHGLLNKLLSGSTIKSLSVAAVAQRPTGPSRGLEQSHNVTLEQRKGKE